MASALLAKESDLAEARVTFIVPPGFNYVAVQWGIWLAGGIAVPHCISHPDPELAYALEDTQAAACIAAPEFEARLKSLTQNHRVRLLSLPEALSHTPVQSMPQITSERRAMILFTSGTTSRPKGVVLSHANLESQIKTLVKAWGWQQDDYILDVLPLHHTHGLINVLGCALWCGATCEFLPRFNAADVWRAFIERPLTLFMAVPTIYNRLISFWEAATAAEQQRMSEACRKMRLMVSGSAALPVSTLEKWREISGHTLLERYGMTEIGMALSNPLRGERRPGFVGEPLPGVICRVVDESGQEVSEGQEQGELQVKGANVFKEYWNKPEATIDSFVEGWFRTGDIVTRDNGYYRILGRNSVDIIKTGGYKVSALEIEEVLRTHPRISECAVVGLADEDWGECVCAAIVLTNESDISATELRNWAKTQMAAYKVPTRVILLQTLPRNVMGKLTKRKIKELFD